MSGRNSGRDAQAGGRGDDIELFGPDDLRAADAAAAEVGVPVALLMEAAGGAALADLRAAWPDARRTAVLCGPGNNGGDGFALARAAQLAGLEVQVLDLRPDVERRGAAAGARAAWLARGEILPLDPATLVPALADADVIVDALFGSGLDRALEGDAAEVAARLDGSTGRVLAVDVPSGIDARLAVPPGPTVRATRTVQLAGAVPASALAPARFAFGTWTVADIGLPESAFAAGTRPRLVGDASAARDLPAPAPDAHKYQAGAVLVVAGSERYAGAAELACRGAHRGGAGLVTLIDPGAAERTGAADAWPETIRWAPDVPAPESVLAGLHEVDERRQGARVIGPGLAADVAEGIGPALAGVAVPTVLDASALTPALRSPARRHGRCWLTPHHGEAARLLELTASEVGADPIAAARRLAREWGAGVVLKGAGAVVAAADGRVRVVAAGHPAMASGGTGDVLAGLLGAALAAPHEDALVRVAAAVHLHGRAGERAARRYGLGMRASDLAEALPGARRALGGAW